MIGVLILVFVIIGVFLVVNEDWLYPGHPRCAVAWLLAAILIAVALSLLVSLG